MWRTTLAFLLLVVGLFLMAARQRPESSQPLVAPTPPMGWNSWDCYAMTINESELKANAQWLSRHLKQFGWQYIVVDEGWYLKNPGASACSELQFTLSNDGRYLPASNRFPSSAEGAGFKPLADYAHSLGLKFGLHIVHGIPREAVAKNLPIADSSFRAVDAANLSDTCPWDCHNYGVKATPAGQAYYDSVAKLYAGWGLDLLKVDCIASQPYNLDEIRMISLALKKTGRPIVLHVSPGPTPLVNADEVGRYAQMLRIADDFWDYWGPLNKAGDPGGQSLYGQFATAVGWAPHIAPDHWADGGVMPIGYLGPRPGSGPPRWTRFTHDEQRTLLTLWSIFRSPLTIGGDLLHNDEWTISLLTNAEIISIDQHSTGNQPVIVTDNIVIWRSRPEAAPGYYFAIFNRGDAANTVRYAWNELGLASKAYRVRDLWEHKELGTAASLKLTLPPHACVAYRVVEGD